MIDTRSPASAITRPPTRRVGLAVVLIGVVSVFLSLFGPAQSAHALTSVTPPTIYVNNWTPPSEYCNGDICTTVQPNPARYLVQGSRFKADGPVYVAIYRSSDGSVYWSTTTRAWGGWLYLQTNVIDCRFSSLPWNAYVYAYDYGSARWSNAVWVKIGCLVL